MRQQKLLEVENQEIINFEPKLFRQLKTLNKEQSMAYTTLKSQNETPTLNSRTLNLYQSTFRNPLFPQEPPANHYFLPVYP